MTRTKAEAAANPHPTTITHNGERYVRLGAVLAYLGSAKNEQLNRARHWSNTYGREPLEGACKYAANCMDSLRTEMINEFSEHNDPGPTDADHDRETARLNRAADAQAHNQQIVRGR